MGATSINRGIGTQAQKKEEQNERGKESTYLSPKKVEKNKGRNHSALVNLNQICSRLNDPARLSQHSDVPSFFNTLGVTITAVGKVTIGTSALGICSKNKIIMNATTIISMISSLVNV